LAEILAITWSESELTLRRAPSEGVWRTDKAPLKTVNLPRPTRSGRLDHPESGGQLGMALVDLLQEEDINIPCWLLMPPGWAFWFRTELPDLKEQALIIGQLRWEIQQRLTHDPADYRFVAALLPGGQRWSICVVKEELIARCLGAAKAADLELSGIGTEPISGEEYSFEHPLDLRDGLPVEAPGGPPKKETKKVSPVLLAVIGVALIITVAYLFSESSSPTTQPPQKTVETAAAVPETKPEAPAEQPTMTPGQAAVTPPVETEPLPTTQIAEIEQLAPVPQTNTAPTPQGAATPTAAVVGGSPFRAFFKSLPPGASTQVIVLSSSDLKAEVSGVAQPDQWIGALRPQSGWSGVKVVGKYDIAVGNATAIRISPSGWKGATGEKPSWASVAQAAGLKVKGRIAVGSLDAALTLLDKLWENPSGASKISLAPQGNEWVIAVQ